MKRERLKIAVRMYSFPDLLNRLNSKEWTIRECGKNYIFMPRDPLNPRGV